MGKYEVTQGQYEGVVGQNPAWYCKSGYGKDEVQGMNTSSFPVERVSWDACQTFLKKLDMAGVQLARRKFALPYEDEWEYACRGGQGNEKAFYVGNDLDEKQANFGLKLRRTSEVGLYAKVAPHP